MTKSEFRADSEHPKHDSAQADRGADEELTAQPTQERADTLPPAETGAVAASPEQLDLPANPPFAPEKKNKAAEAAERAAERAAEKKAAQEEANTFPFGVTVGQVYDGPLDLLLDLIRKQDIDIYDIPIAKITGEFLAYAENLKQSDVDSAAESIYMAYRRIDIKSKTLLPRSNHVPQTRRTRTRAGNWSSVCWNISASRNRRRCCCKSKCWRNPRGPTRPFANFKTMLELSRRLPPTRSTWTQCFARFSSAHGRGPVLDVDEDAVTAAQMIDYVRRRLIMEDRPVGLRRCCSM